VEHGGHLGFLARRGERFWADEVAIGFVKEIAANLRHTATAQPGAV